MHFTQECSTNELLMVLQNIVLPLVIYFVEAVSLSLHMEEETFTQQSTLLYQEAPQSRLVLLPFWNQD